MARYRDVFAAPEFRVLYAAQVFSVAGDQLARVALTVLVYARTGSARPEAAADGGSIAPQFAGGLLSGLSDRWPRRTVMIGCDLARAPLAALMAVPRMPCGAMIGVLCAVTALGVPFGAARSALYPDILGDAYPLCTAVTMTTYQAAQVAGFVADGAVVGAFGARAAVLADADTFDAGTFLASAGLLALGVRGRPAPAAGRLTLGRQAVRVPMLLGWLSAFYNLQKGIAVPLPAAGRLPRARSWPRPRWGRPTRWALASLAGSDTRQRLTVPLAFGAYSVLALAAVRPGLPGLLVILLVAGLCDSYQVQANAAFVAGVPDGLRARRSAFLSAACTSAGAAMMLDGGGNLAAGRAQLTMAAGIIPSRCSASQRPPFRSAPDPVPVWLL